MLKICKSDPRINHLKLKQSHSDLLWKGCLFCECFFWRKILWKNGNFFFIKCESARKKRKIDINLQNTKIWKFCWKFRKCKQKKNGSGHLAQFPDVGHPLQRVAAQHHWEFIVKLINNTIIIYFSTKKFNIKTNSNTNMRKLNNVDVNINVKNPLNYQNKFVIVFIASSTYWLQEEGWPAPASPGKVRKCVNINLNRRKN